MMRKLDGTIARTRWKKKFCGFFFVCARVDRNMEKMLLDGCSTTTRSKQYVLRVRARYHDGRFSEPIVGFTTVYKRHLLTVLRTFHSSSIPLFIDLDKMVRNNLLVQRGARPDEWLALRCRPTYVAAAPSLQVVISLFNGTNNEYEALSEALRWSMPSPVKPTPDPVGAPCALRVPDALCCPITMDLFKDPVHSFSFFCPAAHGDAVMVSRNDLAPPRDALRWDMGRRSPSHHE